MLIYSATKALIVNVIVIASLAAIADALFFTLPGCATPAFQFTARPITFAIQPVPVPPVTE